MLLFLSGKYLLTPASILLLFVADHLEKGLQQPVVSVPVRLGSVEAISVVAVDIVLGASVLVDHVQGLVQGLRGQPCGGTTQVGLLLPPGGRRPAWGRRLQGRALPVEGRLQEAQQGHGGGGGGVGARLALVLRQERPRGLLGLRLWRRGGLLDPLLSSQTGASQGVNHTSKSTTVSLLIYYETQHL